MNFYPPWSLIARQYEITSHPMMGGMGIVYFCMDKQDDRTVALKTFRPEFLPDRATRERFLRESKTWIDLGAHPNIVSCYEVFYRDPTIYLVLELVAREQGYENASLGVHYEHLSTRIINCGVQ